MPLLGFSAAQSKYLFWCLIAICWITDFRNTTEGRWRMPFYRNIVALSMMLWSEVQRNQ
jgi:hypothetical protein